MVIERGKIVIERELQRADLYTKMCRIKFLETYF